MKVIQLLRLAQETLENIYSKNEAEVVSKILMEHCTGIRSSKILMNSKSELPVHQEKCFEDGLQRLLLQEPIQYITGTAWFYHLQFQVNKEVLVPRPETEELAERIITYARGKSGSMLDVGTGSGCIPISILKHTTGWKATAVDISANALEVAALNAEKLGAPVNFTQMNFLDKDEWSRLGFFNIIVSNPPYIPENEKEKLSETVRMYEPHLALFVDEAMKFYKAIAEFGKDHLYDGGMIFMEVHQDHAQETSALFRQEGYAAAVIKDMSGNERMVEASLNR